MKKVLFSSVLLSIATLCQGAETKVSPMSVEAMKSTCGYCINFHCYDEFGGGMCGEIPAGSIFQVGCVLTEQGEPAPVNSPNDPYCKVECVQEPSENDACPEIASFDYVCSPDGGTVCYALMYTCCVVSGNGASCASQTRIENYGEVYWYDGIPCP